MRVLIASLVLLVMSTASYAACDPAKAPYYHQNKPNSIGSNIMDVFLFLPTAVIAGMAQVDRVNPYGTGVADDALCMPKALAKHLYQRVKPEDRRNK